MQCYRCWAEIDLSALRENLAWLRHRVGSQVKLITVVKADAYGHGLKQIAAFLMQSGTDVFGVANLSEARAIRDVGKGWPILMLGACLPEERPTAVRDGIMPTISTLDEAREFSREAVRLRRTIDVHVKVDTGLARLGIPHPSAAATIAQIRRLPRLKAAGIYTHYASAEDDPSFTQRQEARFRIVLRQLHFAGIRIPMVHANNSAGILHAPQTNFNGVRPGLLVYGIVPRGGRPLHSAELNSIKPALSFRCRIGLIKDIKKGVSLSYGATFTALKKMRIATLTAGYGDGYMRAGSNRSIVLIGGKRCRILGRITMDQMLADVSSVPTAKAGDEAVLIGGQGNDQITVHEVARWCRTIPWEVLTNISYRVPRVYRGVEAA